LPLQPVPGQADRYGRDRKETREPGQILKTAVHFGAVIDTRDQNQLCVEIDPGPFQTSEILEHLRALGVPDQRHPELWVGGMDGNVHRADLFALDALPIGLIEVRQGHEVAVQHGIAEIVVHDVERLPHSLGNLLDETERAGVFAQTHPVEGGIAEGDAPVFVAFKREVVGSDLTVMLDVERHLLRLRLELEVECIEHRAAIDRDDPVSLLNAQLGRERARRHSGNHPGRARHQINASIGKGTQYGHAGLSNGTGEHRSSLLANRGGSAKKAGAYEGPPLG
jgi:hypothetical protein